VLENTSFGWSSRLVTEGAPSRPKCRRCCLTAEPVKGPPLPLQGIYHVECSHRLAAGMLSVGDCVSAEQARDRDEYLAYRR
jgi:hypothetical protein